MIGGAACFDDTIIIEAVLFNLSVISGCTSYRGDRLAWAGSLLARTLAQCGMVSARGGESPIVVDFVELDAIDGAGLRLLVSLHTSAAIAGLELKLMNPSERTRELLTLKTLDSVLEICSPRDTEWLLSAQHPRRQNPTRILIYGDLIDEFGINWMFQSA